VAMDVNIVCQRFSHGSVIFSLCCTWSVVFPSLHLTFVPHRLTFSVSPNVSLCQPQLVAFPNSGVRGDIIPGGVGRDSSILKAKTGGEGIVDHTKYSLSVTKTNISKDNHVASLGDAFKKTDLDLDEGLSGKMNRHLEGTCVNQAFGNQTELKDAVDDYIADLNCTTESTSSDCEVGVEYGWPMNTWCVGAVTSFKRLFLQKSNFNEDISSWQTGQVTDMEGVFYRAYAFNQDIGSWNVSSVTDMGSIFDRVDKFNQDIGSWNVDRVTTMRAMFYGATAFNQDIGSWNVDRLTNMEVMLYGATAFNQDLCTWGQYYKSSGVNYASMFTTTACPNKGEPASADGPWCSGTTQSQCTALLASSPTSNPTGTPTSSPSPLPTSSPTIVSTAPWEIHFLALSADFSVNSVDELILTYYIGKDRQHNSLLFKKDCITNVTDITVNNTEPLLTPNNATFEMLTLGYSINKSMIANSTIWNATSSQIELCQVVQLKEGAMVIVEDIRQVTIDFDLLVDYEINNSTLGAATINAANDTTEVASYIEACTCDVSFTCNTNALVPGAELIVCIKSVSPDVEIDFLDSMVVFQEGASDMAVIDNNGVVFPSFTSREYVMAKSGVVVSTFVPTNLFDYNRPESVIGIAGEIVMKLADSGRGLKDHIGAKFDATEEASFEIEVNLQRKVVIEEDISMNSAASVASSKGFITPVMVMAWSYAMW